MEGQMTMFDLTSEPKAESLPKQASKDWIGNSKSTFVCNGASNHSKEERQVNDYYATEPKATELLLAEETFSDCIWECACGEGHIAEVLKRNGYKVICSDLYDRGYPGTEIKDFFETTLTDNANDIITNPPYKFAKEFVEHAINVSTEGTKIAMFLKLTFLESKSRRELFDNYPPKTIYVSSSRLQCAKNGDFETYKCGANTAVAYAWYVWVKGYKGETIVKWIN